MYNLNEISTYGNGRIVLNRYNYFGGLSEQPIMQFCEKNGISLEFISVLWEAFETNSVPDAQQLMQFDTSMILQYLEKTHAYYLDKLIPEIELNIYRFAEILGMNHPVIQNLMQNFNAYKCDLIEHITDEEKFCFSYAKQLINGGSSTMEYKIDQFVDEHEHKEDELTVLLQFLNSNIEDCDALPFKMILSKMELLKRDMFIHATVEDEVLVPKLRQLESQNRN